MPTKAQLLQAQQRTTAQQQLRARTRQQAVQQQAVQERQRRQVEEAQRQAQVQVRKEYDEQIVKELELTPTQIKTYKSLTTDKQREAFIQDKATELSRRQYLAEPVVIGGKTFTRRAALEAERQLQRELSGKKGSVIAEDSEAQAAFKALAESPKGKAAFRKSGFDILRKSEEFEREKIARQEEIIKKQVEEGRVRITETGETLKPTSLPGKISAVTVTQDLSKVPEALGGTQKPDILTQQFGTSVAPPERGFIQKLVETPIVKEGSILAKINLGFIPEIGKKVGRIVKDPSLIGEYFKVSRKPDVVYDIDKGIAYKPGKDYQPLKPGYKKDVYIPPFTLGEVFTEPAKYVGQLTYGTYLGAKELGEFAVEKKIPEEFKLIDPTYYGKKIGEVIKDPSRLKDYFRKTEDKIAVYDIDTKMAYLQETKDLPPPPKRAIPPEYTITKKKVKEAVGFTGGVAAAGAVTLLPLVSTPLVATLYTGEVITTTKPYGYDPLKFAKEEPLKAGILAAPAIIYGTSKAYTYLTKPIVRETATGFKVTSKWEDILGTKVKLSAADDFIGIKTEYLPSKRGKYFDYTKIDEPILNLKTQPIGVDFGKKVIYPKQKLEQVAFSGQRTVVKEIKGGILGLDKTKKLYEGVPYVDPIGYKKQFKYLKDLFGEKSARAILRYTAPTVQEQFLKGTIKIKGRAGVGYFSSSLKQPVMVVDETLGIKTRAGKTIKKAETFVRIGQKKVVAEISTGVFVKTKGRMVDIRGLEFKGGVNIVKASKMGRITDQIGLQKLKSVSVKRYIPKDEKVFIDFGESLLIKKIKEPGKIGIIKSGRKSSEEYLRLLYQPELKAPKITSLIKKTTKKVITKPSIRKEIMKLDLSKYPKMVGGTGIGIAKRRPSPDIIAPGGFVFVGGKFVKDITKDTGFGEMIKVKEDILITEMEPGIKEKVKIITPLTMIKTKIKTKQFTELLTELKVKVKVKERIKILQEMKIKTRLREKTLMKSLLKTGLLLKKGLKQKALTTPRTKAIFRAGFGQGIKRPTLPRIPTPKIPRIDLGAEEAKVKRQELISKAYLPFVRKFGRDVKLGEFGTLRQAKLKLKRELIGTLGASGFLKLKKGKKERKIRVGLGRGFRPSRIDPMRVVQIKEERLGTSAETREVQYFRKQKKGGRALNIL